MEDFETRARAALKALDSPEGDASDPQPTPSPTAAERQVSEELERIDQALQALARPGDDEAQRWARYRLAWIAADGFLARGRVDPALPWIDRAAALAAGRSEWLLDLGRYLEERHPTPAVLERAQQMLEQALEPAEAESQPSRLRSGPRLAFHVRANLAETLYKRGDLNRAEQELRRALSEGAQLGGELEYGLGTACRDLLAAILWAAGRIGEAARLTIELLATERDGMADPAGAEQRLREAFERLPEEIRAPYARPEELLEELRRRRDQWDQQRTESYGARRVRFETEDGWNLAGSLSLPPARRESQLPPLPPGAAGGVMVPGAGGSRHHYRLLVEALSQPFHSEGLPFASLAVDPRGQGMSATPEIPTFAALRRSDHLERAWLDGRAAVAHLRLQPGVDGGRLWMAGASFGGAVALRAAAGDRGVRAVVLLSASPAWKEQQLEVMAADGFRHTLIIASEGERVFAEHARKLAAHAPEGQATLWLLPGSQHGLGLFAEHPELPGRIAGWLAARLKPPTARVRLVVLDCDLTLWDHPEASALAEPLVLESPGVVRDGAGVRVRLYPGVLDALARLRDRGIRISAASWNRPEPVARLFELFGIAGLFTRPKVEYHPDKRRMIGALLQELAAEGLPYAPEEVLYVDDRRIHLDPIWRELGPIRFLQAGVDIASVAALPSLL